jgi:hypothetical protein
MSDVEVSRTIAASPEQLYDIVSDLPRMCELSKEHEGGNWVDGATGPAVGAKFKGRNANERHTWSTIATVETADPGKQFAFGVAAGPMKIARWGYRFEPVEGGTLVTESWDDRRGWLITKIGAIVSGISDRATHNRSEMEYTLEALAKRVD